MIKVDNEKCCVELDGTLSELCLDAEIIIRALQHYFDSEIPGSVKFMIEKIFEESKKDGGPRVDAIINVTELAKQLERED